jgi:hypothetical protein
MIRLHIPFSWSTLLLGLAVLGQASAIDAQTKFAKPPLGVRIRRFDLTDAILREGISELSLRDVEGLHLGFEEIIRDRIQDDPWTQSKHFSLHLEDKTVGQILDALCQVDARYTWAEGGATINVFPRDTIGDQSYLLNLQIERLSVTAIPDPDQALTPLWKLFPQQQIGYMGAGLGGDSYTEPWTIAFENLSVRQFINRIAEHMGPQTSWLWQGGRQERMFTFLKGGFNTQRPHTN